LLATQVTSRIRDVFGVTLPLRDFFAKPTVAGLASRVSAALATGEAVPVPSIDRVPRDRPLPLSFAQQRLWFLDQLQPGSPVYNMPVGLRLSGRLEIAALRASLSEVVRRHESLRTVFSQVDGEPVQRIQAPAEVSLPVIDLGGLGEGLAESELARLAGEYARRPFDLAAGPLLRCALVRLGETEHAALLNQHHIVSDGWSTGVLVHEIVTLYSAFVTGQPSPLPELAVQYADFAVWQRGWLAGEVLERQVSYWRQRLAGVPALLELPTDRPRPAFRSQRGARLAFHLSSDTWRDLKALGRREGVTEFMTLLALFQALLGRLAGQEELTVGTVVANRGRSELEPLIGFFANTLVMRGDLSGRPSARDLLLRARESALEVYAHQDLPFEQLVEALQPVRATSYTPLFQVMLVLQNAPAKALSLPGLQAVRLGASQTGGARFDLTLDLGEAPPGLAGSLEYATDLFDRTTISRLAGHFATLLSAAVAAPSSPVADLPLLGAAERQQLLLEWNDTGVARRGAAARIHELFERQAARRPQAPAVAS
ncbi:MAG TPA: condensation domain-containing protein, partial [Thermoanaerobaculia bacterium]